MRFLHSKDPLPKQKKLALTLKPVVEAEFKADDLVKAVSSLGFEQVIPAPLEEQAVFLGNEELAHLFGPKLLELEAVHGRKLSLPPTHFFSLFKKYLENVKQHGPHIVKWFYIAPVVSLHETDRAAARHEVGIFILGEDSVIANAQLINAASEFLESFGIESAVLELNSLGCRNCQRDYQNVLIDHLQKFNLNICSECTEKLQAGRLTFWRCEKRPCREFFARAPQIVDSLDADCRSHLVGVLESVDALGIPYNLNPLLSGLISHERIFFRLVGEGHANIFGEGANYSPWAKYLGAEEPVSLIGFLTIFEKLWPFVPPERQKAKPKVEVFLIALGDAASRKALILRKLLSLAGIKTWEAILGRPGIKNQLKEAEAHNPDIALIIGQKEALDETVILRDMRSGMQEVFSSDRIIEEVKKRLR